jgi:PPK2 family polyphosphate:nucleotide phosphotransferase
MAKNDILHRLEQNVKPFRITSGRGFRLKAFDPGDTRGLQIEKSDAAELLKRGTEWLAREQELLYAQDRWSLLLIFQAMDAAGKDSTIKHVMSGINPQGCHVCSFKQPSAEELDHDFLWRYRKCLPARGQIGIFNRSYYEEVLVVRVHRNLLEPQKLPDSCMGPHLWTQRLEDIVRFEQYLTHQGTIILKFFLHVSRAEQKKRFLDRLDKPEKHWKFALSDVHERAYWSDYQDAYEQAIRATASRPAPWFVVPADNKWFTGLVVAAAIVQAVEALDLSYPRVSRKKLQELRAIRKLLERER